MKATLTTRHEVSAHEFRVEHEGQTYDVVIHTNGKGKFIDDQIMLGAEELDNEGEEGEVREAILDYLDENWNKLVAG